MLVAGYGPNNAGYYAVDVTNPDASTLASGTYPPDSPLASGPHFRWQLTTMPTTNYPIFGSHSAHAGDHDALHGPRRRRRHARDRGRDPARRVRRCADDVGRQRFVVRARPQERHRLASRSSGYAYRTSVRCWGTQQPPKSTDPVDGRAVAVVRVDTGEILRVFERKADAMAAPGRHPPGGQPRHRYALRFADDGHAPRLSGGRRRPTRRRRSSRTPTGRSGASTCRTRIRRSGRAHSSWTSTTRPSTRTPRAWSDGQPLSVTPTLATDTGRQHRAQRGHGRDGHVRLERDRVRLLDHGEGAAAGHHDAAARASSTGTWPRPWRPPP